MTDAAVKGSNGSKKKRGFFASISLFLAQVVSELRKVVAPTRRELVNYWLVVLAFVVLVMIIVGLLDALFSNVAMWTFTSPPES